MCQNSRRRLSWGRPPGRAPTRDTFPGAWPERSGGVGLSYLAKHSRKRSLTWHDRSRCSPANGPICPWTNWPASASEFGYDGLELACWGDHFEVDKALAEDDYCAKKRELLEKHNLQVFAISAHLVGQAVLDNIDARHKAILPPLRLGRRQSGRRQRPGRRGDEEHRPGRPEAGRRAWSTASPARASGTCSIRSRRSRRR